MPPFRNPFNRRPANLSGLGPVNDENARPGSNGNAKALDGERPSYSGSRASSGISINKSVKEPDEFKMSGTLALRRTRNGSPEAFIGWRVGLTGSYSRQR